MWNRRSSQAPNRDQLSVLIGVILLGLAITQFIQLPNQQFGTTVFGSPLVLEISGYWMIVGVLVVLAGMGTDMLVRTNPNLHDSRVRATFITWILPGMAVLVAARALDAVPKWPLWLLGLGITGVAFGSIVIAEYLLIGEQRSISSRTRLFLNITSYVLALSLYAIIYQTRSRSLITATTTMLVSFLIALDLLWISQAELQRTALLAAAIGLVMGECAWALNYWRASVWSGSLFLLLVFYTASGLALQHLANKLSQHILLEFVGVAAVGLGLLIAFHP